LFIIDTVLDASFSENFYGLRRVSCHSNKQVESRSAITDRTELADVQLSSGKTQHLTRSDRRRSLFFLVSIII